MSKLKRLAAPKFWPIKRKINKYVICPVPGPHSKKGCIPLGIILRDILHCGETLKEVKEILNKRIVKVSGKVRTSYRFPVGLMDTISVGNDNYRLLIGVHGLCPKKANDTVIRLARVENKVILPKGKTQLNLHNGYNMLVDKDSFSVDDVLIIDDKTKSVKDVLKLKENSLALITGGNNAGSIGKITGIRRQQNVILIDIGKEMPIPIPKKYVFVVGEDKPVVDCKGE